MHYHKRYFKIIEHFQKYTPIQGEWHHVTPRCLGGNDNVTNLVLLPYKAHFLCHWILTKMYPQNKKIKHAFAMMCVVNPYQNRKFTAAQYEISRKNRNNALRGVPRTEETKQKLRKPKANKENYKKPKSLEHRLNISKAHKGRKHHWQQKVVNSEGYQTFQANRRKTREQAVSFHRQNFISLNISRKEYYALYEKISPITLKRYLTGL